ncbi:polysaccharide pyruvyl transferase family protein, partial [Paenibacillus sp. AR247]|uniref:polysaccharide pyruvyl transferase family protein n=1 Tax=Paenibacillus sp. AR247 TaxID=1631599 RepID=UPI000D45984E
DVSANGSVVTVCRDVVHPQQMLAEVGRCDVVIGMRLHSLIYAANQLVPMIGVSYDPKIDNFLKRLDLEPVGTSTSLAPEALKSEVARLLSENSLWQEANRERIAVLKEEAQAPAQHIIDFLQQQ